ncbi:MAG: hypothetical protein M3Q99_13490 [Acidobacteriota bacterium]|nr:hypothetical protein [Acidobacteriota bacterium]
MQKPLKQNAFFTYLRLQNGTFFLRRQDKFTHRIVGWKVSPRMTAQLVIDVFL